MNAKKNFANNTLSETVYSLAVVIACFISSFFYGRFFATFALDSFGKYAGFFACVLMIGGGGFLLSQFGQRNLLSLATVVLLPILLYDSIRMWKYVNLILWLDIASVLTGGIVAFFYTKRKTLGIKKASLRKKVGIGVSAQVMRCVICVFLLIGVITGKSWINHRKTVLLKEVLYRESDSVEDVEDYENSLDYNIGTVAKIDPKGGWSTLSLEEKADVLATILRIECRYLGMNSAPILKISYLKEHTLGSYNRESDTIYLSYEYIVDTNAGGYNVTQVLLHENYHRYQHIQTELLAKIRETPELAEYEKLYLFSDSKLYQEELDHYISGSDGSAASYWQYASQALEVDAERYSNNSIYTDYYERIQEYLSEN